MNDDGSCIIGGCIDALSSGFNSHATYSDGSCPPDVPGCTDSAASNYRFAANSDNGSICRYVGCLDSSASNFDSRATIPGECITPVYGCTDSTAINYYFYATVEDGTCFFAGCTDSRLGNYDGSANVDNGLCDPGFFGCTEAGALNYHAVYSVNNGLCSFGGGCTTSSTENFNPSATFDDGTCSDGRRKLRSRRILAGVGCMDPSSATYDPAATTNNQTLCSYPILGCTDSLARNYLVSAESDQTPSECTYAVLGCTIPDALNYDSSATVLDKCIFARPGCTISTAANYLPSANVPDDESCLPPVIFGCADPEALDYSSTATMSTVCTYDIVGCADSSSSTYTSDTTQSDPDLCVAFVFGCMLPQAVNYVLAATRDDGSCQLSWSPPPPPPPPVALPPPFASPSPPCTSPSPPSMSPSPPFPVPSSPFTSPSPPSHQAPALPPALPTALPPDSILDAVPSTDNLSSQDAGAPVWLVIVIVAVALVLITVIVGAVFYMRHKRNLQGGASHKWFGSRAQSAMTYVEGNTITPSEAKPEPPTSPDRSEIHGFGVSSSTEYSMQVGTDDAIKSSEVQVELNYAERPTSSAGSRAVAHTVPTAAATAASWLAEQEESGGAKISPDSGSPPPYRQSGSEGSPSPKSFSQIGAPPLDSVASGTASIAPRSTPVALSPGSAWDANSESNSEYGDATASPDGSRKGASSSS